jgi:multimeric flavodoxin WrbA
MKILVLIGSPRKGSNTDLLVDRYCREPRAAATRPEKIYLNDYQICPV